MKNKDLEVTTETTEQMQEKIETIGSFLKQIRLKKDISITKVAEDLCIRKVYIQAIEDSNYKELPAVPYGIGFVRSYAAYLGLNVERIVELYKDETAPEDGVIETFEPQDEITYPSKQYIIGGIVAAFVVYLIYSVSNGVVRSEKEELLVEEITEQTEQIPEQKIDIENEIAEEAAEKQEIVELKKAVEQKAEDDNVAQTIPQKEGTRIVVKIKGETWFQAKSAEKAYIAKIVNKGFEYDVPAEKGIVLTIGRPYFADVYVDGELRVFSTERKPVKINIDDVLTVKEH